tara:strand:+ start:92169 stop:93542 length:1374 start_codon:yes stop_codon:yes gene_type:complete
MTLRIHDTYQRKKVEFEPHDPRQVQFYVCGPTVYDYAHIGNARPIIIFDVLYRLLNSLYPQVTYIRNITDIDDKINARAAESGEQISEITKRTTAQFHEDIAALGALPPDVEPRATDHVAEMIMMIEDLIDKGHAYVVEGHVLFFVPSWDAYGQLSGHTRDELVAGARIDVAPYKKDPADFVLWKPSSEELPGWSSPWGRGRPGWHIECSAMATKYFGSKFDIHGGGQDLIFPHHENEMAQCLCNAPSEGFAKYWMHNGYLLSEGEKMSKSLGNFYTINELLREYPGEAIRLLLLKTHYRQPLDFSKSGLDEAKRELDRFYRALREVTADTNGENLDVGVSDALNDDLNTPLALSVLHAKLRYLNNSNGEQRNAAAVDLRRAAKVLGLLEQNPEDWFRWAPPDQAALDDEQIKLLIVRRSEARAKKDFAESDRIRNELIDAGIILEDKPDGTIWRRG